MACCLFYAKPLPEPILRHRENFGAFTGPKGDFGLILLILNMIIHKCFSGLTQFLPVNVRGPVSFVVFEYWLIVNWIPRNKFQWNLNRNANLSFKKMSSAKCRPFCLGLNVLTLEWVMNVMKCRTNISVVLFLLLLLHILFGVQCYCPRCAQSIYMSGIIACGTLSLVESISWTGRKPWPVVYFLSQILACVRSRCYICNIFSSGRGTIVRKCRDSLTMHL